MKIKLLLYLALLPLLLAAGAARAQPPFRVVGYLPAWRGAFDSTQLRQLTHVNYAFVQPTAAGGLEPLPRPERLRRLAAAAHAAGVRVLISVGGWHDGDHRAFDAIGASGGLHQGLHWPTLLRFVAEYQLDGVDLDWEHPDRLHGRWLCCPGAASWPPSCIARASC